jgi:hypothetical protein
MLASNRQVWVELRAERLATGHAPKEGKGRKARQLDAVMEDERRLAPAIREEQTIAGELG